MTTQQGGQLIISPCKWCTRAGSGNTDRMVVYCNRIDRICFNLTQPLRRMETEYAEMRIKIPLLRSFRKSDSFIHLPFGIWMESDFRVES